MNARITCMYQDERRLTKTLSYKCAQRTLSSSVLEISTAAHTTNLRIMRLYYIATWSSEFMKNQVNKAYTS